MKKPLRVLMVEDSEDDVLLTIRVLKNGGYDPEYERVETAVAMRTALREKTWDIILCDYQMPKFNGLAAIALLKETGIDIPMIIVSGAIGEETAASCMRYGAHDYVMKGNLSRLVPAIERELEEAESRRKRKLAEEETKEAHERLVVVLNGLDAIVYVSDMKTHELLFVNKCVSDIFGDIVGQPCWKGIQTGQSGPCAFCTNDKLLDAAGNPTGIYCWEFQNTGNNRWYDIRDRAIQWADGRIVRMEIAVDITDRKQAEVEARERMKELQALYGLAEIAQREGITLEELYKESTNILPKSYRYAEIACARMVIGDSEFRTKNFAESPWMQSAPIMVNREVVGKIEVGYLEERPEVGEGPFLEEERFLIDAIAERLGHITGRKRAEEKLLNLTQQYDLILSSAAEGILGLDLQGNHTFVNSTAAMMLGYDAEELLGRPSHSTWHHTKPDGSPFPAEECGIYTTYRDGAVHSISTEVFWRKDGTCFPVEYASTPIYEQGRLAGVVVTFMDISERKLAEEDSSLHNLRTQALLDLHLMMTESQQAILDFVLTAMQKSCRSQFAFIGLMDETESFITIHAWSKDTMAQCSSIDKPIHFPISEAGVWGDCVRQRKSLTLNDYEAPWPSKKGYPDGHVPIRRFLSVPIFDGERIVAVASVANKKEPYTEDDDRALNSLVNKMWEILRRGKAKNDLEQSFSLLQKALTGTVQAMATVVESRDPYTAGHQRRVAELAQAIASEMRLPIHQIDGIRMAAVIHDLGKMAVPAEILSKPTKLKKSEFELIQDHPNAGYEILKDIAFPWPIARIILEHHEKVDGSGYPNGSMGENTLLESKILTVADVVEAMASHRPYRPTLGIDAALNEIEKNRGIFYDKTVADACLRLFREKGFQIEGT